MIPNIVHFVYFSGSEKSRPFSFLNYMAVRAAFEVQRPDKILFWYDVEPSNNPSWDSIKQYVTLMQADAPTEFEGIALEYPQYQSDIVRLHKLIEYGGIYLDTDTLLLKPLDQLMGHKCVMSADGYGEEIELNTTEADKIVALNAGLIMVEKDNEFIKTWLSRIPLSLGRDKWAAHMTKLAMDIYRENPSLIELQPAEAFIPFNFHHHWIYGNNPEDEKKLANSYAIHVWETVFPVRGDAKSALSGNTIFGRLFGKYAMKKRLKICVYTIALNEEHFVERWANSAKDADLLLIADTGSKDGTVEKARSMGISTHEICVTPWRFDIARNASMTLIPRDMDVCICMDMDEVLEPGWREEIERVWTEDTTRLGYYFDWGCGIRFRYEKIHARHGYMWHHPCHEYPIPDPRIQEKFAETTALLVSHHPDPNKSRGQYLALLEVSVKEDPECPRNAFYYARELSFACKWQESINELNRYLALPRATWNTERCYAYRVMGRCYEELGNQYEAEAAYHRACAEAPNTREPWCGLAMLYYRQSRWAESFSCAMRALDIKDKALVYTCDPEVWGFQPHDLASISAWHLGLRYTSIEQAALALALDPENPRLKANLNFVSGGIAAAAE